MKTSSKLALLLLPVAIFSSPAAEVGQPNVSVAATAGALHTQTATEIVRMQAAGVEKQVITAYVQTLHVPYRATADDVLYLHQQKVPDEVILEWINRGAALTAGPVQGATSQFQAQGGPAQSPDLVAANTPPAPPVIQQAPAQPVQTVIQTQPTVVTVPSVVNTWPAVSLGVSWGWPTWGWGSTWCGPTWGWGGAWRPGWGGTWCGPWRPGWGGSWGGPWRPGWGGGWHGGGTWAGGWHGGGSSGGHGSWAGGAHFTGGGGTHFAGGGGARFAGGGGGGGGHFAGGGGGRGGGGGGRH